MPSHPAPPARAGTDTHLTIPFVIGIWGPFVFSVFSSAFPAAPNRPPREARFELVCFLLPTPTILIKRSSQGASHLLLLFRGLFCSGSFSLDLQVLEPPSSVPRRPTRRVDCRSRHYLSCGIYPISHNINNLVPAAVAAQYRQCIKQSSLATQSPISLKRAWSATRPIPHGSPPPNGRGKRRKRGVLSGDSTTGYTLPHQFC